MNDTKWVLNRLQDYGEIPFCIYEDRCYSYKDLVTKILAWQDELKRAGVKPGECISLIGDYSPNVISLFCALIINENIIVPISSDLREKFDEYLTVAEVNKSFEFKSNDCWEYSEVSEKMQHPLLNSLRMDCEPGLIIFTSGTSGKSKAAVHKISRLIDKYKEVRRAVYRTVVFLKLDHIGGINTLFSIMLNGGTIVTCKGRTPRSVCEVIEKHKIELLPTTPTFLNMLLISKEYLDFDLSSLKLITYGTEPMPQSTIDAMSRVFPSIHLKQTYGLTELGIFPTKSKDSASNFMKVGGNGVEIKIIDNTLWIRSASSMLGYLNAPSPFDEDGWYNTGDQVEVDDGYIRILGRKVEIINVGGEKVYPSEVESILMEIPNVEDVLVTGKKSPITGQVVAATFVLSQPEDLREFKKRVIKYCRERLAPYKIPLQINISDKSLVSSRFKKIRDLNGSENL
jgi:acyl-CoA synthetase (AMP-forming)/AMP-acid ligase II